MNTLIAILTALFLLIWPQWSRAQTSPGLSDSILLPPTNLELYQKPPASLTNSEYWRIKIHGLRNVALHQSVWGARKTDKTEGHRVVPMKHFYLRSSERKDYQIQSLEFEFEFHKIGKKTIINNPSTSASVFEIEFAGEFEKGQPGDRSKINRGYVIRLSAFPPLESGIFYQSHQKYLPLKSLEPKLLKTGKKYTIKIELTEHKVTVLIDGEKTADLETARSEKALNKGLISMITGWNPIKMSNLEIKGSTSIDDHRVPVIESGIASLPAKEPKYSRALAGAEQMEALDEAIKRPQEDLDPKNP